MAVFEFIEGFHDSFCRHCGVAYMSPVEYERKYEPRLSRQNSRTVYGMEH